MLNMINIIFCDNTRYVSCSKQFPRLRTCEGISGSVFCLQVRSPWVMQTNLMTFFWHNALKVWVEVSVCQGNDKESTEGCRDGRWVTFPGQRFLLRTCFPAVVQPCSPHVGRVLQMRMLTRMVGPSCRQGRDSVVLWACGRVKEKQSTLFGRGGMGQPGLCSRGLGPCCPLATGAVGAWKPRLLAKAHSGKAKRAHFVHQEWRLAVLMRSYIL